MKYIQKIDVPQFFIDSTKDLRIWKEYYSSDKRKLKQYILEFEQNGLCCYCEADIKNLKNKFERCHIEHIKPKAIDKESLTFDYYNLVVSCNGNLFNENEDDNALHCGHKKNDFYDDMLFLNPLIEKDISEYFVFDYEGQILASEKELDRANYTINILNLNGDNNRLAMARKNVWSAISKALLKKPISERNELLTMYISDDSHEFITYLRYKFRKLAK